MGATTRQEWGQVGVILGQTQDKMVWWVVGVDTIQVLPYICCSVQCSAVYSTGRPLVVVTSLVHITALSFSLTT